MLSNAILLALVSSWPPPAVPPSANMAFSGVRVLSLSAVSDFATPWTSAHQALLSIGVSRQEHWSGLPFPSPRDLPDPGIVPGSPALQADSLLTEPPGNPKNTGVGIYSFSKGSS